MTTVPAPAFETCKVDRPSDVTHWWCCDPNTAICGKDISAEVVVDDDVEVNCVVCVDLADGPCPLCRDEEDTDDVATPRP